MSAGGEKPNLTLVPTGQAETDAGRIVGPLYIEIAAGTYSVSMSHWETARSFGTPKVAVTFGVTSPEQYAGTELVKWYRVKAIDEHGKRCGRFTVGPLQFLVADHVRLVGPLTRAGVSLDAWRELDLLARVETVESASGLLYSVIRRLERAS